MPLLTDPNSLLRLTKASYGDGISSMSGTGDAPDIGWRVFDQEGDMPNSAGLSTLFVDWGQFLDHDLDLTRDASGEFLTIPGLIGPFQRSVYDPDSGTSVDNPRAPVNEITHAIDAGMVYGSTAARTAALRSFEGGRLRVLEGTAATGDLLPLAEEGDVMAGARATASPIFLAGDVRANENINLTMLHTLFVREHNFWADRLLALNPDWSDETLFQTARGILEYEIQKITYSDWLPLLLTGNADSPAYLELPTPFTTPEGGIDGQITVEFSTAAFRFGHTMVTSDVAVMAESGAEAEGIDLAIADVVFNPEPLLDGYFDHILRGQATTLAQEVDGKLIDDLNFFLRGPDGLTGFSLAALNILRSRDHGIAPYLEVRAALLGDIDLDAIEPGDYSVITSDISVQAELARAYGSVFDVDLWVGGLVEDRAPDTQMGPVFAYILIEQFERTRAADDGFLTLPDGLGATLEAEIEGTALRDIILRNSDITFLQDNPFFATARLHGTEEGDGLLGTTEAEFLFGLAGDDLILGSDGADTVIGGAGADTLEGGDGNDHAAYSGARACYNVELHADGTLRIIDRRMEGDGTDTLTGFETLGFGDGDWSPLPFDDATSLSETAFRALTELYISTFNRAPDAEGLLFWADAFANGVSLPRIAGLFFDQDETRALYPDLSDPFTFVGDVYRNVLGREADPDGQLFWTGVLQSGAISFGEFVLAFLEGARAAPPPGTGVTFLIQQTADLKHLTDKTDLGIYFSAIKGMSDVEDAQTVMQMFDATGMELTKSMVDDTYLAALDPDAGDFMLSLVGVVGDPFDGM